MTMRPVHRAVAFVRARMIRMKRTLTRLDTGGSTSQKFCRTGKRKWKRRNVKTTTKETKARKTWTRKLNTNNSSRFCFFILPEIKGYSQVLLKT